MNQTDANGLKQGYWILYGKDFPEKGYCDTCKVEEGTYRDGKKTAAWLLYHTNGVVRLKTNFVDARPHGAYGKYDRMGERIDTGAFDKGKIIGGCVIGGLYPEKTINAKLIDGVYYSYYPSGCIKSIFIFNELGKQDGPQIYYYDGVCDSVNKNKNIQFELTKINGVPVGEARRYCEDGTLKEMIFYDSLGVVVSSAKVNECPPAIDSEGNYISPLCGANASTRDGKKFKPDGYNKLINEADELWLDGMFKNGYLYEGKHYLYDVDGILLKIEIWKNGAYCCDGQL